MFKKSNKIILIDDNAKDLDQLSKVFFENGIGCRTFKYDAFYADHLQGVRFLFLDINLNGSQSEQQRNSTLKDAIVNYIHEDNGPFVLILWTNNTEWIDSFKNYINRDANNNEDFFKRNPFYLTSIDKNEFYDKQKDLEDKIKEIFDNPIISALFAFEDSLSTSVSKTISKIIDIIPSGTTWGDNDTFQENLQKVFSKIAVQTLGYHYAKENPDMAIKEAMLPIFSYTFVHEQQTFWNEVLNNLKTSKKCNILFPSDFNEAKLNSIFHIDDKCANNTDRGAVCPLLLDLNTEAFFNKFGYKYEEWFSISFPDVKPEAQDQSTLICVEFSSACDYSQQKKRTNKYLLGEILPAYVESAITQSKSKGDFLLLLPKFEIGGVTKIIGFNLNFTFTVDSSVIHEAIGTPLFRLKKEIMDMIGNKYANHISRIGITSFKQ